MKLTVNVSVIHDATASSVPINSCLTLLTTLAVTWINY